MKLDLIDLLRADTAAQARCESYGLDPVRIETWLQDRAPLHSDPTATEALRNVARWEKKRGRKGKR